jgi:ABC-type tungstate transport system permease subunit
VKRYPVMYNDFVLIGPKSDPAGIKGTTDVAKALQAIKAKEAPFISRGDRSGTHIAELDLWKAAGIDISKEKSPWYKEIGQGMGAALNTASAANAYVLADRGTWLSFTNRGDLDILVAGDKRLFNQYGVILVNPEKHPHSGESGKASACKERPRPSLHQLARFAGRPKSHCRLQGRRRAIVLSERQRSERVTAQRSGWYVH